VAAETETVPSPPAGTNRSRDYATESSAIGRLERPLTVALGGALVISGLRRRSVPGSAVAPAGGWLLYRGLGNRPLSTSAPVRAALGKRQESATDAPHVARSVTVDVPAEELHEYWRKPEALSEIMGEFAQVTPTGGDRLHWRVDGPLGRSLSWETRFVEDTPGEVLRWETVEGTRLPSEWAVTYGDAPAERGTEVTLRATFDPPGGPVGAAAVNRLGFALEGVVTKALYRFKSVAETGETPTLEGNPSARGRGDLL